MPGMYLAGDMIVLGAGKYLFVWDPILCWIGIMLATNVVVGRACNYQFSKSQKWKIPSPS